jgi:hypothetical protein
VVSRLALIAGADSVAKSSEGRELAESKRFLAAMPNSLLMNFTGATASPVPALLTLPFRIMPIASMPRKIRLAVRTAP